MSLRRSLTQTGRRSREARVGLAVGSYSLEGPGTPAIPAPVTFGQAARPTDIRGTGGVHTHHHHALSGLGDDDHHQYALLAGRALGQLLYGGVAAGENLTLGSTAHATKGKIILGTLSAYDELNGRLGVLTLAPSYPLHVVGQGYFTTQLGVGVAPSATRGVNVMNAPTALASNYGIVAQLDLSYAGGAWSSVATGIVGLVAQAASQNVTRAEPGIRGIEGRTSIAADNVTVAWAAAVHGSVVTSTGTARAYTSAAAFYASNSIAAGGYVGTFYGFYMPVCSGATRWGFYIADDGAPSYSAADLILAATKGLRWDGDRVGDTYSAEAAPDYLLDTVGGVPTLGRIAGHIGIPATGRCYWNDEACAGDTYTAEEYANYLLDTVGGFAAFGRTNDGVGIPAEAGYYLDGTDCAGDTYIRESAPNVITFRAGGTDQWDLSDTYFSPVGDNLEDLGRPTVGIKAAYLSDANTTAPTAEGEVRIHGTQKSLEWFVGGQLHQTTGLIYCRAASTKTYTSDGNLAESTIDSFSIPAALLVAGNTFSVHIQGFVFVRPTVSGGNATFRIKFRIEGTDVIVMSTINVGQSSTDEGYYWYQVEASLTVRSATEIECSAACMAYDGSQQGLTPWPDTWRTPTIRYGISEALYAAAGACTVYLRGAISNAIPTDVSYISVEKFNVVMQGP